MRNYKDLLFDKSFINGEWVNNTSKKIKVINPANGELVGEVYDQDRETLKLAINYAHTTFASWKNKTAKERSVYLMKWFDLIIEHKIELATIMSLECGKPIGECNSEIIYGASYIQWYAEQAKRNNGITIPPHTSDKRITVIPQPIGVVGSITPWNFPMAMIARKIAPALAVGCTVVARPSELTPFSALALVHLADLAGFPTGVLNMIVGENASEMGKELCENPKVSKISFTGSTRVGQILMKQSSSGLKKLSLELGGNAPFIVFKDANIDEAVEGAIAGKFRFSGQTCVCVNRFLIHESIHDEFVEKFVVKVEKLKIGGGLDKSVDIGPLINNNAVNKMKIFIADAQSKNGDIVTGGTQIEMNYFQPTVITNCSKDMRFAKEEIFGPIAPIYKFKDETEAIEMANDTAFGLASYFYTNNLNQSIRVSEALEYGMVGINTGLISTETAPFGGVKHSGQGREGSVYGLDDYTELKYICTGNVK